MVNIKHMGLILPFHIITLSALFASIMILFKRESNKAYYLIYLSLFYMMVIVMMVDMINNKQYPLTHTVNITIWCKGIYFPIISHLL